MCVEQGERGDVACWRACHNVKILVIKGFSICFCQSPLLSTSPHLLFPVPPSYLFSNEGFQVDSGKQPICRVTESLFLILESVIAERTNLNESSFRFRCFRRTLFFIREYIFAYKLKNRLEYSIHFMLLNSTSHLDVLLRWQPRMWHWQES